MADYGSAVSQKGYDVKTCADRFLVYSSAFKNLKVYNRYSVSTTVPASGGADNTITINHNLGYYAPFLVVYNGPGNNIAQLMTDDDGYTLHFSRVYNSVNTLTIVVDENFGFNRPLNPGDTVYFTVYIFLEDFTTVAESNINSSTSSGASSTDYGIRISKDGYDVKTCTYDQLVLSSSFFTSICHKIGINTSGGLMTVSHNLGYVPACLAYIKKTGESVIRMCEGMPYYLNILGGGSEGFFYKVSATTLSAGENYLNFPDSEWRPGNTLYYIIFKDAKLT
jgi:hypothetical protein